MKRASISYRHRLRALGVRLLAGLALNKNLLAFITLVITILALQVQFLQYSSELKDQARSLKLHEMDMSFRHKSYRAALFIEVTRNLERANRAMEEYDKTKVINMYPQFVSDMYTSGLANGELLVLDRATVLNLLSFYNSLPEYRDALSFFEKRFEQGYLLLQQCKISSGDCSEYQEAINSLTQKNPEAAYRLIKQQRDALLLAEQNLAKT